MVKTNTRHPSQKKRHGLHHRQNKHYHSVYLPYLPAILMVISAIIISGLRLPTGHQATLAYATEMSQSSLLRSTNEQREAFKKPILTLNNQLSAAAQAKANDMASRNYWSHNTPDGNEPWIFVDQAGYKYQKAGENLAYGFSTSNQVVVGWMNSSTHKANLLDNSFSDVGFGFANANDFQQNGKETVVVAMYGRPVDDFTNLATLPNQPPTAPETLYASINSSPGRQITRIQALTEGRAPWALFAVGILSGAAITAMFINHGLRFRRFIKHGEMLILHHPALDINMLSLIALAITLSQQIGVIL